MEQKKFSEAIDALQQAKHISPNSGSADFGMGQVYVAAGDYDKAIKIFSNLPKADQSTPIVHFQLSVAYAGHGDKERALVELQEAIDSGYRDSAAINSNPHFNALRSDARFQKLLQRASR